MNIYILFLLDIIYVYLFILILLFRMINLKFLTSTLIVTIKSQISEEIHYSKSQDITKNT